MIPQIRKLTITAVHGETDRDQARRALDEQMARARDANGQLVPRDQWPEPLCAVEAVLTGEDGTRVELTIRDWGVAASIAPGRPVQMTIGPVPVVPATAVVAG